MRGTESILKKVILIAVPIYEYEPEDRDCLMCEGHVSVIQSISEPALKICPWCGMGVKKIVSRASFKLTAAASPDKAGTKGFTTFKKTEKGVWEKIGGVGPDYLVGSKEDVEAVEREKAPPKKVIDLDETN